MHSRRAFLFAFAIFSVLPAAGQTTNLNLNLSLTSQARPQRSLGLTHRMIPPFGVVAVAFDMSYPRAQGGARAGNDTGTISFVMNRLDGFDIRAELPNGPGSPAGPR